MKGKKNMLISHILKLFIQLESVIDVEYTLQWHLEVDQITARCTNY